MSRARRQANRRTSRRAYLPVPAHARSARSGGSAAPGGERRAGGRDARGPARGRRARSHVGSRGRRGRGVGHGLLGLLALLASACGDTEAPRERGTSEAPANGAAATEAVRAPAAAVGPERVALAEASGARAANARVTPERLARHPAARVAEAGSVPEQRQRPGDAERGRRALLEEGYVACGLPLRVFRELVADEPLVPAEEREAAADGLPYFVNATRDERGVEIASGNCLVCHGTPLFGELVIGLGNEFADFTENPSAAVERAGALVRGAAETAAWERYADRVHAIAPHMTMATVGTNPANNLTAALIAHRDPETNAWSEEPLLPLPPTEPAPVSVPPWWRMAKKHAMFNLGEGRGDHGRIMMAASMLCSDSVSELDAIDAYAPDIRAFIASLEPPAWPFDVDAALAARGREVFDANCSACHGRYAHDADGRRDRAADVYPNRLVPLELVGTDPMLVEQAHSDDGIAYVDWFNRSYYGRLGTAAPGPGYVAPPLDGIWATAPFLHNGSVPSVRALLDGETRPARWRHVARDASDPEDYDREDLGWRHVADEAIAPDTPPERVYDTSRAGHANTGHRFGDHLSDAERDAVIEYLKTL